MSFSDYEIAAALQREFANEKMREINSKSVSKRPAECLSLIDSEWELIDPTPDIHSLFIEFDKKFFWSKLGAVSVSWSKRMTTCAGVCRYAGTRMGGQTTITLSEPLLKLRPRKDLIETLLHEMIHAYLFVTRNNRDRDGHGPEFHKHMYRINTEAKTNISVYHDFHDEVRLYKTHWWRCNGPCSKRSPYYGMVKRATNRKPGPNDRWWTQHERSCGGVFLKIREADKTQKRGKGEVATKSVPVSDIRSFGTSVKSVVNVTSDINAKNNQEISRENVQQVLRDKWANRFLDETSQKSLIKQSNSTKETSQTIQKSSAISTSPSLNNVTNQTPQKLKQPTLLEIISQPANSSTKPIQIPQQSCEICPSCSNTIPVAEFNSHWSTCTNASLDNDLEILDAVCPICSKAVNEALINAHIDNCLQQNFINEDLFNASQEIVDVTESITTNQSTCLVCNDVISGDLNDHLEVCLSGVFDEDVKDDQTASSSKRPKVLNKIEKSKAHVRENIKPGDLIVQCPSCPEYCLERDINRHLDGCLGCA